MQGNVYVLKHSVPVVESYPTDLVSEWIVTHSTHACLTLQEAIDADGVSVKTTLASFERSALDYHLSRGRALLMEHSVVEIFSASKTLSNPYDIYFNPPESYSLLARIGVPYSGPASRPRALQSEVSGV